MIHQSLVIIPNMKFHENPAGGSRAVLCGQADRSMFEVQGAYKLSEDFVTP